MKIEDFIIQQLGNSGNIYWNWCTDNLWPRQGYYVNGVQTPWCAEFVTCMLEWTGSTCVWFPNSCAFDSSVIPIEERYYAQSIKPLDIISFDFDNPKDYGGDHVGIVLDVYDWGCHTIEGNTDIVVKERDRYWDDILFGIRPQWNEEEMISEEDKRDIARYCAEYVYGEEDTKENLNMYNATHWSFRLIKELRDLVKEMKGNK